MYSFWDWNITLLPCVKSLNPSKWALDIGNKGSPKTDEDFFALGAIRSNE